MLNKPLPIFNAVGVACRDLEVGDKGTQHDCSNLQKRADIQRSVTMPHQHDSSCGAGCDHGQVLEGVARARARGGV